ncbi:MAG: hypothetical protein HY900_38255 [Deltaproteobacteria bacterium]|nr:hypothetical protein [Deltaproteobacteria bacterium]
MSRERFQRPRPQGRGALSIPDDDAIRRWLAVPPLERLRWLAEANRFLYLAQPPQIREIWQRFRREEI